MNEEMMTTGFTGGDTATGPTAGYDPVMKMRAKLKDLKGLVAPGNKLSTSNKKKIKEEDKYDRYKRMIRHKQDKYGKGGPVGADYDTSKDPHYQKQKAQKREKIQKIVNKSKVDEARNTKADANTLRSVSTPGMQSKRGNVNRKGRSVTGGAAMSGMNIRAAGGLGKSKPKNMDSIVAKYKEQVKSDRRAAAKERRITEGVKSAIEKVLAARKKRKEAKKHDYGRDAGAEAAQIIRDKEHKKYVNFLPANK